MNNRSFSRVLLASLTLSCLAAASADASVCSKSLTKRLDRIGNQYGFECALPNGETACVAKRTYYDEERTILEAYLANGQLKVPSDAYSTIVNNDEISHNYLEKSQCLATGGMDIPFYGESHCERSDTTNATYSMNTSTLKGLLTRKRDRENAWYQSDIHDVTTTAFTCAGLSTETLAQNAADTIAALTTKAVVKDGTPYAIGDVDVRAMTVSLEEMTPPAGKIREDLLKLGATQAFNTVAIYNNTIKKPVAPLKPSDFLTGTKKNAWRCFAVSGGANEVPLSLSGSESATIRFKTGSGRTNDLGLTEILKAEVTASTLKTPVFPDGQNVSSVNSNAEKSVFMSQSAAGVEFSKITHYTREEMEKLSGIDREGLIFKGRICVRE
ncbi:MAG: hypothetical protein HYW49_02930 [Deltaproteobacteria bacterium]|nr:hypothetical protein [Deltaproteobacteria bacterium]